MVHGSGVLICAGPFISLLKSMHNLRKNIAAASIRKHVEDGICLPAMDRFLSRHVSHR